MTDVAGIEHNIDMAERIAKSDFPLAIFAIVLVLVVGTFLFTTIRRGRMQSETRDKLCQWKIANMLQIALEQNRLIENMDRRWSQHVFQKDRRKSSSRSAKEIHGHILRVVAGPTKPSELDEHPVFEKAAKT